MKDELIGVIGVILLVSIIIIVSLGLVFGIGWTGVHYTNTVEKAQINADREVFKDSKPFIEGMTSDLAKYKFELETEKDNTAKKAIINLIISKYGNFDTNKIEDVTLRNFLNDIKKGKYN